MQGWWYSQGLSSEYDFHCSSLCPQLYADKIKCSAERPRALFESARFTAQYVRSVGQDVSPGMCVLLSTSKSVRKAMKLWDISGDGGFWKVQLDVRILVVILNSLGGLGLELFPKGLVRLLSEWLRLVRYLWDFRLSWAGSW